MTGKKIRGLVAQIGATVPVPNSDKSKLNTIYENEMGARLQVSSSRVSLG